MSLTVIQRKDRFFPSQSFSDIYNLKIINYVKPEYKNSLLRIIKKTLLGTNNSFWYSKQGAFISAFFNFLIVNMCFVIFPNFLFQASPEEIHSKKRSLVIRLIISNLLDIFCVLFLIINYKFKQKKISKYMKEYTQCSINRENSLIKDCLECKITDNFDIEIFMAKNKKDKNIPKYFDNDLIYREYFFEYVINLPNIKYLSHFLYKKLFAPKEKEIINKIIAISNQIETKNKKKLLSLLLFLLVFTIAVPLTGLLQKKQNFDFLKFVGIFALTLFIEREIVINNTKEQIESITNLNNEFINDGYFIYINNYIISLFYVKEKYRDVDSLSQIKNLNERFKMKFDIN